MLTRKRKETVYRIWLHMVTPSKPLKKRLRSVSYYAQIVTELKQLNNKTGTHTKKVKGENNGKSHRYGKRYFQTERRRKKIKRYFESNTTGGKR